MNNDFETVSEQLTAYLDGELPSEMHEILFEELARSPELREEMNEHLLIRAAVQKDNALPSSRVLDNLLAAVETGTPSSPIASTGQIGGFQVIRHFSNRLLTLRSYVGGAVSLLIGLLAPAIINESIISTMAFSPIAESQKPAEQSTVVLTTASAVTEITVPPARKKRSVMKSVEMEPTENATLNVLPTNDELPTLASAHGNSVADITPVSSFVYANNALTLPSAPNSRNSEIIPAQSKFLPFIPHDNIVIRLRGISALANSATVNTGQVWDNLGLGIFYNLGKGHLIGIDVNNERPQLSYRGIVDNRQFNYQQNPSYLSVGLTYRYNAEQLNVGDFHPFAELSGGLAIPNMPVGRTSAGINFVPTDAIRFSVGLEYNTLQYEFLGNNYSSSKWGINYGMMINMDAF